MGFRCPLIWVRVRVPYEVVIHPYLDSLGWHVYDLTPFILIGYHFVCFRVPEPDFNVIPLVFRSSGVGDAVFLAVILTGDDMV